MEAKKMKMPQRSALGRGLSALISTPVAAFPTPKHTSTSEEPTEIAVIDTQSNELPNSEKAQEIGIVTFIPTLDIVNNPKQPRTEFGEAEIEELATSIKTNGVLQPLLVRPAPMPGGARYELIAGERRWRASQRAGLTQVPVIIKHLTDRESLEIAIVENVQRQNLTPIEEARAYHRLSEEFALSHQEIAERVGKDRASVSNHLRILKLPSEVIELIRTGDLSMGHAKAILTIKEPSAQLSLAKKSVKERLSVRDLEAIVSRVVVLDAGHRLSPKDEEFLTPSKQESEDPVAFPETVNRLRNALGTKVLVRHKKSGRGRVEIEYFSEDELSRVVDVICGESVG